jgi:hypothetical protein
MRGIRSRVDRLRSKLGPGPTAEHTIVRIGTAGPADEWYDVSLIGCAIPQPTPELAEALLRFNSLGMFGVELGTESGMPPDEEAELRGLILASAVDDRQRRILTGVRDWDVVWEGWEMEQWITLPAPGDETQ